MLERAKRGADPRSGLLPSGRTTCRQIFDLKWARRCDPVFKKPKLEGSRAAGLLFEAQICKRLEAHRGVWFEFEDRNGYGCCSPDGIRKVDGRWLVLECKLTHTLAANEQLEGLYGPILAHLAGEPPLLIQVCKNLTPEAPLGRVFGDFQGALAASRLFLGPPILHVPFPKALAV